MTYTDADLEPAARRLCEMRGLPPAGLQELEWLSMREAIRELRAHLEREQALREVRGEQIDPLWEPCKHDNYVSKCQHCEDEEKETLTLKEAVERCMRPAMPPSRPITFGDKP